MDWYLDDLTPHDFMFMFISQLIDSAAIRLSYLYIRHWIRTCYINLFLILAFFWFRLLHLHCCHNFLIIASNFWALVFLRYFITSFGHFECLIHIGHISESRISNCIWNDQTANLVDPLIRGVPMGIEYKIILVAPCYVGDDVWQTCILHNSWMLARKPKCINWAENRSYK